MNKCLNRYDDVTSRLFVVFHYDRGRLLAVFIVNRFTMLDPRFTTLQSSTLKSSEILRLAVKKKKETRLRFNFYNDEIKVRRQWQICILLERGVTRLDTSSVFRGSGIYRFILTAYILRRNIKTSLLMHAYRQSRKLYFPYFIMSDISFFFFL